MRVNYQTMTDDNILNLQHVAGGSRGGEDGPGEHWVTIDGHPVLIHEAQGKHPQHQGIEQKAMVGYGETAGLLPEKLPSAPKEANPYDASTYDPKSVQQLQKARENIIDISGRNTKVNRGAPSDPHNRIQKKIFEDNMDAARNSDGSKPGKFFFIRQEGVGKQRPSKGFGQGKPILTYGPFRNVGGGDVPRGNKTYVDIYDK